MLTFASLSIPSAFAQANGASQGATAGQQGAQAPIPPAPIPPDMNDASPPIPVTREIVQRLVDDKRARVMTPKQIDSLRDTVDAARQAGVSPYPKGMIAEPRSRPVTWRPEVSMKPQVIEMWQGTLSTIVFTDMNGNAWNIKSASFSCDLFDDGRTCGSDSGSGGAGVNLQGASQGKAASGPSDPTNMISLQANQPYSYGNVVIRLDGLPTPVIFVLRTGKSTVTDMEVDVRVEGRNPAAPPSAISMQGLPEFDPHVGEFLNGIPPQGAVAMKVSGDMAEAWTFNGALYVRSRLSLLSPAFTDHGGSAEGVQVYKYPGFVPQILASVNGVPTWLNVTGN
ncbi:hypothetical protein R70006_04996 [Paraburkholderia domus]|nr:hypothetical protein R70006_04996 [Paraburkholderia domus]